MRDPRFEEGRQERADDEATAALSAAMVWAAPRARQRGSRPLTEPSTDIGSDDPPSRTGLAFISGCYRCAGNATMVSGGRSAIDLSGINR